MTNRAIEIHDSKLQSITITAGDVVLDFSSAYIHQSDGRPGIDAGTGWTQHVVIRVRGDGVSDSLKELPCDLWSGYLILNGRHSDNLIPVPLGFDGDVGLHLYVWIRGGVCPSSRQPSQSRIAWRTRLC
jgi:hypothetical protein